MTAHIFLDFDGTLIDSLDSLYKAYLGILNQFGIEGSRVEFDLLNGPSIWEVTLYLKKKYGIEREAEEIYKMYNEIIKRKYLDSKPFSDSVLFLEKLKNLGVKSSLVTSGSEDLVGDLLKRLDWSKYFQFIVYGTEVKESKPSPLIYLKALELSKARKEKVIVVEDSKNGIKAAIGAGLKVYGLESYHTSNELKEAGAHKTIEKISSLIPELN